MAVQICEGLHFPILNASMYHRPQPDIQFWTSRYIMGLNRTSETKVITVWIWQGHPSSILRVAVYYGPQSDIWVKSYGCLILPRASLSNFKRVDILLASIGHPCQKLWPLEFSQDILINFLASQYFMGLNWTSESKVMAQWICLKLLCLILSISICYGPYSNILVKSYMVIRIYQH